MKRTLTRIIPFLLLGALANIAIAWLITLAVRAPDNSGNPITEGFQIEESSDALAAPMGKDNWATHRFVRRLSAAGTRLTCVTMVSSPSTPTASFNELLPPECSLHDVDTREEQCRRAGQDLGYFYCDSRGWPFLSLSTSWPWFQTSQWPNPPNVAGIPFARSTAPDLWPYNLHDLRAIPLRPLFPGFLLNTLFYAAILAALSFSFTRARRALRRRRGRCPHCNYDRRGNLVAPCPECGTL